MTNNDLTYNDLFKTLRNEGPLKPQCIKSRNHLLKIIRQKYEQYNWEPEYENKIKSLILNFLLALNKRWIKCNRIYKVFTEKNEWLKTAFIVPFEIKKLPNVGRPKKAFIESSKASKRRKVEEFIKTYTASELMHAVKIVMQ